MAVRLRRQFCQPGSKLKVEAWEREPARLVLLDCPTDGDTRLMSLNTFLATPEHVIIISLQKYLAL